MRVASSSIGPRFDVELRFAAAVALKFDTPLAVGETADGVRFDFTVRGTVRGPALKGEFPSCAAYLLIDRDGVGTINVRAPLLLQDGALAELEATGRYDFGEGGYQRAVALDLPNSALGWCPRLLTGDPRYLWLNRALCLGVGELRPGEARVDYDLFTLGSRQTERPWHVDPESDRSKPRMASRPLYERLGGTDTIRAFMAAFVAGLHSNTQLQRQNPRIANALRQVDSSALKRKIGDFVCRLAGGPCDYHGRTMRASHAHLGLNAADWDLGENELVRALNEYRVPEPEQRELLTIIGTLQPDIVTRA